MAKLARSEGKVVPFRRRLIHNIEGDSVYAKDSSTAWRNRRDRRCGEGIFGVEKTLGGGDLGHMTE